MKVRRIDFSPDEWLTGTAELSPYDRGVYITICALIYSRGGRIGIEVLRRHCGVHGNALNASLARLENARKIVRNGSEIGQKRSEKELEIAQKRSEKWLENLPESKNPNGLDEPPARARSARVTRNHQPSTTNINLSQPAKYETHNRAPAREAGRAGWLADSKISDEWIEEAAARRAAAGLAVVDLPAEAAKACERWQHDPPRNPHRAWLGFAMAARPEAAGNGNISGPTEPPPSVEEAVRIWETRH